MLDRFPVETSGPGIVMVFEYMENDLARVLKYYKRKGELLKTSHIKCYLQMLLKGIAHVHKEGFIHRVSESGNHKLTSIKDLKPANLLIDSAGVLKLADFGLARLHYEEDEHPPYTNQIATRWYKSPELLYGSKMYDQSIDIWAVGCILGEMLLNSPLFAGESDIDQLQKIFYVLGVPTESTWPVSK
jgi:cell cycle related kinase